MNLDIDKYCNDITEYIKQISKGNISPSESLRSLVESGICDVNRKVLDKYKIKIMEDKE